MERRRKGLGTKKTSKTPEKDVKKSIRRLSSREDSKPCSEEKNAKAVAKVVQAQKSQPAGSVTPKQKPVAQQESPCSPMMSPGPQTCMMFPILASPEIEVSWDWSCSQVPKDMLPLKKTKRESKAPLPNLNTINMFHRPRPPREQQISEEENQKRLEFYKNILAIKSLGSPNEVLYNSTNNNLNNVTSEDTKSFNTPKRPTTRLSASKKKNEELFDDSANEFMIECSQAIEEKLKNGEIDMGPIVGVQISQSTSKRLHSPGMEINSLHKKSCHGRINLFPDESRHETVCSKDQGLAEDNNNSDTSKAYVDTKTNTRCLQPDFSQKELNDKSNLKDVWTNVVHNPAVDMSCASQSATLVSKIDNKASKKPSRCNQENLVKQTPSENTAKSYNNPSSSSYSTSQEKRLQPLVDTSNPINVKPQYNNVNNNNKRMLVIKSQNPNANILRIQQNAKQNNGPTHSTSLKESDLSSLLDDDFDVELSNLDVDSLCRDNEPKHIQAVPSCPRLCTQQEIEAKRQAALQKLMKKKKR